MKNNERIIIDTFENKSLILRENGIIWHDIDENDFIKEPLKKAPTVYIYINILDQSKMYIGSSVNMSSRMSKHRSGVANYKNGNTKSASPMFFDSVLEYGWYSFKFGVEYVNVSNKDTIKEILLKREQYYLDSLNPSLNISRTATSPLGLKHNIMFSINLSKSRKGIKYRTKIKNTIPISKAMKNETILKLSARYAGVKVKIFDKSNNLVKEFSTITETAKYTGVSSKTVRNIMKTGISYDDYTYKFEAVTGHPIVVVNKKNNYIKEYCSINAAAKDIAVRNASISSHINTNKLLRGIYLISRD